MSEEPEWRGGEVPAGYDSASTAGSISLPWEVHQRLAASIRNREAWVPPTGAETISRIGEHAEHLTLSEMCLLLGISRSFAVQVLAENPEIGGLRIGEHGKAQWRVPRDGLMQWVMAQRAISHRPAETPKIEQPQSLRFRPGHDFLI